MARFDRLTSVSSAYVAPKGGDSGGFKNRNKELGAIWARYNENEKLCFSHPYFLALLDIPEVIEDVDEDGEAPVPASTLQPISQEDRDELTPIYHRLVNIEKVRAEHDKVSPSISGKEARASACKDFRKICTEVRLFILIHVDQAYS